MRSILFAAALLALGPATSRIEVIHPPGAPHALLQVDVGQESIRAIELRTPRGMVPDVARILPLETFWVGWDWLVDGRRLLLWSRTATALPTCTRGWVAVEGGPQAFFAEGCTWRLHASGTHAPAREAVPLTSGLALGGCPVLELELSPMRLVGPSWPQQVAVRSNVPDTQWWVVLLDHEVARGGSVDVRDVGAPELAAVPAQGVTDWAGSAGFRLDLVDGPLRRAVRAVVVFDTDGDQQWSRRDLHQWALLEP